MGTKLGLKLISCSCLSFKANIGHGIFESIDHI